jgi:hypothetical protein
MEQRFDTSFIPQKPIFKEEAGARRHEPIPIVTLIGFAIFFAMLILTGLTFFFDKKETESVEALSAQLGTEKDRFNPQAIEELKAMSARLSLAKKVIDNHVGVTGLLDLIQSRTLKSVYYQNLRLTKDEKRGYTVALQGEAPSFGILYAQLEEYRQEPKITHVDTGDTRLNDRTGAITFDFTLTLSPEVLKYIPPSSSSYPEQALPPGYSNP